MSLDNLHLLPADEQDAILNGPALIPPLGVIPNFNHPTNHNTLALVVVSLCLAISTIFVAVGVYAKLFSVKQWHIQDYLAFSGYGLSLGMYYCAYRLATSVGFFVHQWDIRVKDLAIFSYPMHVGADLYAVIIMLYKAAILLEWTRIFVPRGTRGAFYWTCHSMLWINLLFYVSILIAGNSSCTPYARTWDKTLPGICRVNRNDIDVTTASFNLVSHLLILILPQRVIWRLHLKARKKIGIVLVFAVGILACVSAGCRLYASAQFLHTEDSTYGIGTVAICACAEAACAVLVFWLPVFPKAFRESATYIKTITSFFTWSRLTQDGTKGNQNCLESYGSNANTLINNSAIRDVENCTPNNRLCESCHAKILDSTRYPHPICSPQRVQFGIGYTTGPAAIDEGQTYDRMGEVHELQPPWDWGNG